MENRTEVSAKLSDKVLSRRSFLKLAGIGLAGLAALAVQPVLKAGDKNTFDTANVTVTPSPIPKISSGQRKILVFFYPAHFIPKNLSSKSLAF